MYENAKAGTAYVVESKLKVMLEQDYLIAWKNMHGIQSSSQYEILTTIGSPNRPRDRHPRIDQGSQRRQEFRPTSSGLQFSLILATWYKKKIKDSILEQVYADKNKVAGVNIDDPQEKEKIYQRYLQAFKKGVYNYIKEEHDPVTQEVIPRKYFSGGVDFFGNLAMSTTINSDFVDGQHGLEVITADADPLSAVFGNPAMSSGENNYSHLKVMKFELGRTTVHMLSQDRYSIDGGPEIKVGNIVNPVADQVYNTLLGTIEARREEFGLAELIKKIKAQYLVKNEMYPSREPGLMTFQRALWRLIRNSGVMTDFQGDIEVVIGLNEEGELVLNIAYDEGKKLTGEELSKISEKKWHLDQELDECRMFFRTSVGDDADIAVFDNRKDLGQERNGTTFQIIIPRNYPRFDRIYDFMRKSNPSIDRDQFFEYYNLFKIELKEGVDSTEYGGLPVYKAPLGHKIFSILRSSPHSTSDPDPYFEEEIRSDPMLDALRDQFKIAGAYKIHRSVGEWDFDGHGTNPHKSIVWRTIDLVVPLEAADFISFFLCVPSDVFRMLYFGKNGEENEALYEVNTGTRILGKGVEDSSWGGKEKSFLIFQKIGLPYPPGIVLSPDLVQNILRAQESSPVRFHIYLWALGKKFAEAHMATDFLAVRSNPKLSAPGRYSTRTNVRFDKLMDAIRYVADSWGSAQAMAYRKKIKIPDLYDLPIIIQSMVYEHSRNSIVISNMSGAVSTRNPNTNEDALYGRYIYGPGAYLMTGGSKGEGINGLAQTKPVIYGQLEEAKKKLEEYVGPQEFEFAVVGQKVYFLQTRELNFSPQAKILYIKQRLSAGKITEAQAIPQIEELQNKMAARKIYKVKEGVSYTALAHGSASIAGAMQGYLVWNIDKARQLISENKPVIFVSHGSNREQVLDLMFSYPHSGLITDYGNSSSHEAVLTRAAGIPSLINLEVAHWGLDEQGQGITLQNGQKLEEGSQVVIDGDKDALFISDGDVLEENGILKDASYGIDIPTYRKTFLGPYLTDKGTIKPEVTIEELERLNKEAAEKDKRAELRDAEHATEDERKAAFTANLEKHFFHVLLDQKKNSAMLPVPTEDFERHEQLERFFQSTKGDFPHGWWIAFDVDNGTYISMNQLHRVFRFLNEQIKTAFKSHKGRFFGTSKTDDTALEEGYIFIPQDIPRQTLLSVLQSIGSSFLVETSASVSFAVIRGDEKGPEEQGAADPLTKLRATENLLLGLLDEAKGDKKGLPQNYGNRVIFSERGAKSIFSMYHSTPELSTPEPETNRAMNTAEAKNGGIDLTPARMNVEVKTGPLTNAFGDGNEGIKFHLDAAILQRLQNALALCR